MSEIEEIFKLCDDMFENCNIDFDILIDIKIDEIFFEDYMNVRVVNSFLFNFIKIQDKLGSKLFKKVLYEAKEIDDKSISMINLLNKMEQLGVLESVREWDILREIRNLLAHEYPFSISERVENIELVLENYPVLVKIYSNLKGLI